MAPHGRQAQDPREHHLAQLLEDQLESLEKSEQLMEQKDEAVVAKVFRLMERQVPFDRDARPRCQLRWERLLAAGLGTIDYAYEDETLVPSGSAAQAHPWTRTGSISAVGYLLKAAA